MRLRLGQTERNWRGRTEKHGFQRLARASADLGGRWGADGGRYGQADLGTQFAFATSVYGDNRLAVTGNLGYAPMTGAPAAAIRTTYSRELDAGIQPAISVTMRQFFVPLRLGQSVAANSANENAMPMLRTLGFSVADKTADQRFAFTRIWGEMDIVSFIDRLHYFSPYAKLTRAIPRGTVDFTLTSGNPRPELGTGSSDANADLQRDLAAISRGSAGDAANGRARVQYGQDFEAGSRRSSVHASSECRAIAKMSQHDADSRESRLPGFSGRCVAGSVFIERIVQRGPLRDIGYMASATQDLGDNYKLTVMYGSLGVLSPTGGPYDRIG